MKERPILFSGEMIRAILEGRKTQTRRIMKSQPEYFMKFDCFQNGMAHFSRLGMLGKIGIECKYGQPGDQLWVREAFGLKCYYVESGGCFSKAKLKDAVMTLKNSGYGARIKDAINASTAEHKKQVIDNGVLRWGVGLEWKEVYQRIDGVKEIWRPSIHMPRWASRITLEIVNVRVERLKDMCAMDCVAEGIERSTAETSGQRCFDEVNAFHALWNKINGPDAWDNNPWVWVIEFKRVL